MTVLYQKLGEFRHWTTENKNDEDIWCHILCKITNNAYIKFIQIIQPNWGQSIIYQTQRHFYNVIPLRGFNIKYDGKYIYTAKHNAISLSIHDPNNEKLSTVTNMTRKASKIQYYQVLNDAFVKQLGLNDNEDSDYMMISRQSGSASCQKLEL